jgi:predicted RNase H-like HicB family nuclease
MLKRVFTVTCEWDEEAGVWYVIESDVPGLVAEAATREAMAELLQRRVPELIELNMPELAEQTSPRPPVELLIQSQQRIRLACN